MASLLYALGAPARRCWLAKAASPARLIWQMFDTTPTGQENCGIDWLEAPLPTSGGKQIICAGRPKPEVRRMSGDSFPQTSKSNCCTIGMLSDRLQVVCAHH